MFTGIVAGTRAIVEAGDQAGGRRLTVELGEPADAGWSDPFVPGESIALDGACLTVATIDRTRVRFDVIAETLRRTTLGRRRPGDRVNVERALRAGDRLGGHFVQGHVDGVAVLDRRDESPREVVLRFRAEPALVGEMVPRGSVAVDGVSLTLVEADRASGRFAVALIPTTLALTTLGFRRPGEPVNVETDLIGKWVRRYIEQALNGQAAGGVTMEKLHNLGFVT